MNDHPLPSTVQWPPGAIFTLGHSTLPIERFIALLQTYGIERLVDIRTVRGWRNASFRGYADYMQTAVFQEALETLIQMSRQKRVAIMCAEAVPWRCHRSLVADALDVRGIPVIEILSPSNYRTHSLTPFAHVTGSQVTYPASQGTLL